jgi:Ca2+-binding RTX toxin-like protein
VLSNSYDCFALAGPFLDNRYRSTRSNDVAKAAEGNERILGRRGDDTLCGEAGDDRLKGRPGNDVLDGGPGNDILNGGPGADVFRFAGAGTGQDRILDLGRGDTIEIVGRDDNQDGKVDINGLDVATAPFGAVRGRSPLSGSGPRR